MFCEQCGKKIPDNSKFCDGCGAPVSRVEERTFSQGQRSEPQAAYGQGRQTGYGREIRPHGQENRQADFGGQASGGSGGKKKKDKSTGMTVLIVILSIVAVALVVVLILVGIRAFSGSSPDPDRQAVRESSLETEEETETEEEESTVPSSRETAPSTTAPSTTAPSTTASQTAPQSADYILPNSNSAYLTEADLAGLTREELRLARNEIYARHGRKFKDAALNEYFLSKSWYHPTVEPDAFDESVFNDYEIANRKLIGDYEEKMGY